MTIYRIGFMYGVMALFLSVGCSPPASSPINESVFPPPEVEVSTQPEETGVEAADENRGVSGSGLDLTFLVGNWNGSLTYLDYGDNTTQVTLPTEFIVTAESGPRPLTNVTTSFVFTEPDGSQVTSDGNVSYNAAESTVTIGEPWQLDTYQFNLDNDSYTVTISRDGEDDNRAARIIDTYSRVGNQLTIIRTVRYTDDGSELIRNSYQFDRN